MDKKLLSIYFIFLIFSCIFIFSSSVSVANRIHVDSYYFFKHQLFFSIFSVFITLFLSLFNENVTKKNCILLFTISFLLLILVHFYGFQTKGAKRWIYIFGISIQPTEILKPTIILINAYLLEKFTLTKKRKYLFTTLFLYLISIIFIYKQPDIGTLILITIVFFTQIFLTDFINFKKSILIFTIFIILLFIMYITMPHVNSRVNNFILSVKNIELANYQVKRSLIGYQNAGLFGKGFMEGDIKNFIPDVHTDFIFPAITEEFGFIISLIIISLYFYITLRVILKTQKNDDIFKFLSIYGLALLFLVQAVINIGVSLNLLPTKGMTLPFLSYGGSSIIGTSIIFGFLLIFTKKTYEPKINVKNILDIE